MPIYTFEGNQGTGKSLTCTAILVENFIAHSRKVIANTSLAIPYTKFDLKYFLKHFEDDELSDCELWLDEMYQMLDSRSSQGKVNKLLTYFIVQARKRHVNLYVCTHHIDHVDKRLRRAVDVRATCQFVDEDPCLRCQGEKFFPKDQPVDALGVPMPEHTCGRCYGEGKTGWAYPLLYNKRATRRNERYQRLVIPAARYWNLYDTEERIELTKKQKDINLEDL